MSALPALPEFTIDGRRAHAAGSISDPANPGIVFIHGTGQDRTIWTLPRRYFQRHGRNVLAVDLPGHGRSEGPALGSIDEMADWVVELASTAGLQNTAFVGHSMGALVALSAAARHPQAVRALAMVGVAVPMPVADPLLNSARADSHDAIDMLTLWGFSKTAQLGGNATPGMWMLGGGQRLMERAGSGVIGTDLGACNAYQDGFDHAAKVRCPVLLVLGERDVMTPLRSAARLAEAIPDARIVRLPGAGHALLAERPDPVLDALISVL